MLSERDRSKLAGIDDALEKIEDEIVKGIYAGELKEIDQETVNMAVMFVDDIIKEFGDLDG